MPLLFENCQASRVVICKLCLCLKPCRLLLQSAHRFIAFSNRQASARPQCSCSCHNQHQEVWQRVIKDTAPWPSLAGCYWADSVSSGRYSI